MMKKVGFRSKAETKQATVLFENESLKKELVLSCSSQSSHITQAMKMSNATKMNLHAYEWTHGFTRHTYAASGVYL